MNSIKEKVVLENVPLTTWLNIISNCGGWVFSGVGSSICNRTCFSSMTCSIANQLFEPTTITLISRRNLQVNVCSWVRGSWYQHLPNSLALMGIGFGGGCGFGYGLGKVLGGGVCCVGFDIWNGIRQERFLYEDTCRGFIPRVPPGHWLRPDNLNTTDFTNSQTAGVGPQCQGWLRHC